jgi:phosphoglycolate phosphatase
MAQYVIFDMDGTLSDTAKATAPAFHLAAAELGLRPISEARIKAAMGYAPAKFYSMLLQGSPPELVRRFSDRVEQLESEMIRSLGEDILFDGVRPMLAELARRGARLYVASTGSPGHVGDVLSASGIRGFFSDVLCNEPEKVSMVGRIISSAAASASDSDSASDSAPSAHAAAFALVGDKHIDAEAARRNRIPSIGAAYGYCGRQEAALFDATAFHPGEIPSFVFQRK